MGHNKLPGNTALKWAGFGLIDTTEGLCAYGSGILSSPGESIYALKSNVPQRKPFEPVDILRTPTFPPRETGAAGAAAH